MNFETNSKIEVLLKYAKEKEVINWEEITEHLGAGFVNSPEMEYVLQLLVQNNIQIMEEGCSIEDEEIDKILNKDVNFVNKNQTYYELNQQNYENDDINN